MGGPESCSQVKVSSSSSGSLPVPKSVTTSPSAVRTSSPASTMGGSFSEMT